jgi:AmmeMemoRadiSam system protein A
MDFKLDDREKNDLLFLARETLAARFENRPPVCRAPTPAMQTECGAFVTLRGAHGSLRGCIGSISGHGPLHETIRDMAAASAFHDPRFKPLVASELPGIFIELSVLSPMERLADPALVRVGSHGILIRRGLRSGLLLPQVAGEQGWDREQFLAQVCRKAGLAETAWREPDSELRIFTALVFSEPR